MLIRNLLAFGLKPINEINKVMNRFAKFGIKVKTEEIRSAASLDEEKNEESEEDELCVGQVSPKEFEYLLSMPMWSLTEEKVDRMLK